MTGGRHSRSKHKIFGGKGTRDDRMIKTIYTYFLAVAAAGALLFACTACGSTKAGQGNADPSLQKVLDEGKLILGLDASFPPMGYTDEDGSIVGFDIDVAQAVCDRLGIELVKQPINWDEKEDLLNSGEIDCIWNGMSVTAARAEAMNLSDPYMKNEMVFVVPESSAIKTISDLDGKSVGVQLGSTAEEILEAQMPDSSLTVTPAEDNVTLLKNLEQGRFDAVFLDSIVAYYCISSGNMHLYVLPGNLGEEDYAIGFRKDNQALRDRIQELLYEMKQDGTLAEISVDWFGGDITTLK